MEINQIEPKYLFILGICHVQLILPRGNYNYFYSSHRKLFWDQNSTVIATDCNLSHPVLFGCEQVLTIYELRQAN